MQFIIVSAASKHLRSKSRSELYKLINDGWLDEHAHAQMPSGQRLLDLKDCRRRCRASVSGMSMVFSSKDSLMLGALFFALSAQVF